MFAFVKTTDDVVGYGAIYVIASSASFVFNFYNARKLIFAHLNQKLELKKHLRLVWVFFAMACATTIYTNIDSVMLGFMTTSEEVGYYDAAIKIKGVLSGIVTSLGTVILPRASYYISRNDKAAFEEIVKKALYFVVEISLPLVLFFTVFSKETIFVLAGEAYSNSILPMQIIMPTVIFVGVSNMVGMQILIPQNGEKIVLRSEIFGAISDIIINALLIPTLGASGAAVGTVIVELIVVIVQYLNTKDLVNISLKDIQLWKLVIALFGATAIITIIANSSLSGLILLMVAALSYFVTYFFMLLIMKDRLVLYIVSVLQKGIGIKHREF